jgi:hypothetical protein
MTSEGASPVGDHASRASPQAPAAAMCDILMRHMQKTEDVQEMVISDRDYAALKRRKILKSIYSMPANENGERLRFFYLLPAGLALAGEQAPRAVSVAPARIQLKRRPAPQGDAQPQPPSKEQSHG